MCMYIGTAPPALSPLNFIYLLYPYLSLSCLFLFPLLMGGGIACLFCSGHVLVFWYWCCSFVWVCLGGRVGLGGGMGWDGGGRCLLSRGGGKVVGWLFMGWEWDGGDWGVWDMQ